MASPQSKRCVPRVQRSPNRLTGVVGAARTEANRESKLDVHSPRLLHGYFDTHGGADVAF
jgi:hypothetical protein